MPFEWDWHNGDRTSWILFWVLPHMSDVVSLASFAPEQYLWQSYSLHICLKVLLLWALALKALLGFPVWRTDSDDPNSMPSSSWVVLKLPFNIFLKKLFLAVLGLHYGLRTFSSCSESGLLCSCDAQASHRGGLLWWPGFTCSMACRIFPDQILNLCLLHWQVDSYPLYHQGSPKSIL